jgi:hypothetical protein
MEGLPNGMQYFKEIIENNTLQPKKKLVINSL